MSKNLRRIAILLAAVFVMMIMAVPAFADTLNGKGTGYYLLSSRTIPTYSTSDNIKVKVVVQSKKYSSSDNGPINVKRDLTLTGSSSYTVRDVMLKFNTGSTSYYACNNDGTLISSSSTVVQAFKNWSNTIYKYSFWEHVDGVPGLGPNDRIPVDGWMFRVNGKSPVKNLTGYYGGPEGALMYETNVMDGDVIFFYYDMPFVINNVDYGATFLAVDTKYTAPTYPNTNGTLEVQLQSTHDNHCNSQGQWVFNDFQDYAPGSNKTALLYGPGFSYIGTISLDSSGYGTLTTNLDPGMYYISVGLRSFKSVTAHTSQTGSATATLPLLNTTDVYDQFIVPAQ
ncbi:MAG: hypothetical protein IKG17_11520 [Mogibacterium sp.]|nr:hypothetical protein [Mogibacterium sp.]